MHEYQRRLNLAIENGGMQRVIAGDPITTIHIRHDGFCPAQTIAGTECNCNPRINVTKDGYVYSIDKDGNVHSMRGGPRRDRIP
jgi:hypothetical protein